MWLDDSVLRGESRASGRCWRCNRIWQRQADRRNGAVVGERLLDVNRSQVMDGSSLND